jgi:transcriptional regulator with XRE-family HTH domain
LAASARVSQPYLAQLENGTRRRPAFDIVVKIAKGLGVSLDALSEQVSRE